MSPILAFIGRECGRECGRELVHIAYTVAPKVASLAKDKIVSVCCKDHSAPLKKEDPYLVSE